MYSSYPQLFVKRHMIVSSEARRSPPRS